MFICSKFQKDCSKPFNNCIDSMNLKKLHWFSQHELTNGQIATLQCVGITSHEKHTIIFNDNIVEQIEEVTKCKVIGIVAPINYALKLLRSGFKIIEFVNIPSARQRGKFLCKGLNIHTLNESYFVPCPIPIEEQEEGDLNYK